MTQSEYNKGVGLWADDVYRFAVRCGGNSTVAEDMVQESFARLWEHRDEVEQEKGKSFLLTVVHNLVMSHHRHEGVHRDAEAELRGSEWVRPDERFDLREALDQALALLPDVQRSAVLLKDLEGYSCREIGEVLGMAENRVTVCLFRARVTLKKTLIALGYDNNN